MPAPSSCPSDLLALDRLLDDEEHAIRDTVRRFCNDNVRHTSPRGRLGDGPVLPESDSRQRDR